MKFDMRYKWFMIRSNKEGRIEGKVECEIEVDGDKV